jgi:4'-phosphopantetheinyl transferase
MEWLLCQVAGQRAKLMLWKIVETEAELAARLTISDHEQAELEHFKGHRRLEWWAGRMALHRLTGAHVRLALEKDRFDKPFFCDNPALHCSLSHTQGVWAAALLSDQPCGLDVQIIVDKLARIGPKFLRDDEMAFINQHPASEHLLLKHLFWSAKEALYKAYGRKELDFRQHIYVDAFDWLSPEAHTTGWVKKDDFVLRYTVHLCYNAGDAEEDILPFVWASVVEL